MAPTSRTAQAERTRRTVLDAARRLFAEHGFAATSLQQVADVAGVRKANVYYYFRTKDALLQALLEERVTALESLLVRAEGLRTQRERREVLLQGFVDEVVVAHRTSASVDVGDPSVRSIPGVAERLDALWARATVAMFGDHPTADQRAAVAMVQDLRPALLQLTDLPDVEVRAALLRLCRRLLPDRS